MRPFRTVWPVLVSYVLRLVPEELEHGRLIGEVEAVATGVRVAVHGTDELLGFCTESFRVPPAAANRQRRTEEKGEWDGSWND